MSVCPRPPHLHCRASRYLCNPAIPGNKEEIEKYGEGEVKKYVPSAIYVAISLRVMQAIDVSTCRILMAAEHDQHARSLVLA